MKASILAYTMGMLTTILILAGSGCHEDVRRVETESDLNVLYLNIHDLEHKRGATIEDILRSTYRSGTQTNWNSLLAGIMLEQDPQTPSLIKRPDGTPQLQD